MYPSETVSVLDSESVTTETLPVPSCAVEEVLGPSGIGNPPSDTDSPKQRRL